MQSETIVSPFRKWAGTNIATTSYSVTIGMCLDDPATAPIASATRAVLDLTPKDFPNAAGGVTATNILECQPYGTGANNAVITGMRIYGWRLLAGSSLTVKGVWIPKLLVEVAMVFGNIAGPAGGILTTTDFLMDTITPIIPAAFSDAPWYQGLSPSGVTADLPGWFRFDAMGHQKVEFVVDLGANATGFNMLVSGY